MYKKNSIDKIDDKTINIWNKIWEQNLFNPSFPVLNAEFFYKYHLPKKNKKKFKIIDIGCGNGVNLNYFHSKGYDAYGIDISKKCVNKLKKKYKSKIKLNTFQEIDFKNNFFDAVFSHSCLYYGNLEMFKNGIKEITRILKKNGTLRVYTKSKNDYLYKKFKSSTIKKSNDWEKNLHLTFLNKKEILNLLSSYKKIQLGLDEFNYINYEKKHSFWCITAIKK